MEKIRGASRKPGVTIFAACCIRTPFALHTSRAPAPPQIPLGPLGPGVRDVKQNKTILRERRECSRNAAGMHVVENQIDRTLLLLRRIRGGFVRPVLEYFKKLEKTPKEKKMVHDDYSWEIENHFDCARHGNC